MFPDATVSQQLREAPDLTELNIEAPEIKPRVLDSLAYLATNEEIPKWPDLANDPKDLASASLYFEIYEFLLMYPDGLEFIVAFPDLPVHNEAEFDRAMIWAIDKNAIHVVEYLIRLQQQEFQWNQSKYLIRSLQQKQSHIVEMFLHFGLDPGGNNNLALKTAIHLGDRAMVARLLQDERVDPSSNDAEVILLAITLGQRDIATLLAADQRVDPSFVVVVMLHDGGLAEPA